LIVVSNIFIFLLTFFQVFEEVLQSKSSGASSGAGSVRSLHSLRSVRSDGSSTTLPSFLKLRSRKSSKPEVNGDEDLLEGLKRAQRSRLEDQRGTEINTELPDFLKVKFDRFAMFEPRLLLSNSSQTTLQKGEIQGMEVFLSPV